jgi:hypothetical protein
MFLWISSRYIEKPLSICLPGFSPTLDKEVMKPILIGFSSAPAAMALFSGAQDDCIMKAVKTAAHVNLSGKRFGLRRRLILLIAAGRTTRATHY